ncbi:hexitol phosphatase HxpB [Sinomicrobium kalidii]|uniref:hexitol phosphatase HxpB n=1 Tax=Sinomicrobium kalidii TaxID=2900738 RepID=UPI001E56B55A|nr:hexitol phosphatase HxpB [Sinomicrobium kalidii]UGU16301.1 hexitol phosphatase HxpB [Sinomicrobium kalidii]
MPATTTAVIFDMDGVLIDSEPAWKKAEYEVFTSVGVHVAPELSEITATMTTAEVTRFWYEQNPWSDKSLDELENEVVDRVGRFILEEGTPMTGIQEVLELFRERNFRIGLSTNSPSRLIPLVLEKAGIAPYFDAVSSSEHETHGKPHPAVYLTTAKKLGTPPEKCIVFEDSVHGLMSAKNAGMKTIAVPSGAEFHLDGFDIADLKLRQLSDFNEQHLISLLGR